VEVIEGPSSDDVTGLVRVQVKCVSDGIQGWVTVKGNQGTPFLKEVSKPCYFVSGAATLQQEFGSEGNTDLRALRQDEVLEVLEGPRAEDVAVSVRARARVLSDGLTGWITLKSKGGEELFTPGAQCYTCISAIALTDTEDIENCKVQRKLDKGEVLVVQEGPVEDKAAGVTRIRALCNRDKKVGWVTVQGNAGTVYAEESGRQYVAARSTPMQRGFSSSTATTRTLEAGETIEVIEGPKDEHGERVFRLKCRAVADGKTGWITQKDGNVKPWSPFYRCVAPIAMGDGFEVESAQNLRRLEPGELVELVEGPTEESVVGVLRMKCRAEKDGATGWVTIMGSKGTQFVANIPPK